MVEAFKLKEGVRVASYYRNVEISFKETIKILVFTPIASSLITLIFLIFVSPLSFNNDLFIKLFVSVVSVFYFFWIILFLLDVLNRKTFSIYYFNSHLLLTNEITNNFIKTTKLTFPPQKLPFEIFEHFILKERTLSFSLKDYEMAELKEKNYHDTPNIKENIDALKDLLKHNNSWQIDGELNYIKSDLINYLNSKLIKI